MRHDVRSLRRRVAALATAAVAAPAVLLPLATPAAAAPSFTKIEGAAANAAGLTPTVDAYRALLGNPNNGATPGSQPAGRREINWDGVPANFSAPNLLPANFFNSNSPRGAVFAASGGNRFQVSSDVAGQERFANINPQYKHNFGTFSPKKLFTPIGTNTMKVHFFVPGSHQRATVKGFGAVFTDVDRAGSTKIELYDRAGHRLWWRNVPKGPAANKSLSFLGVKSSADIYEVRITSGNVALAAGNNDGGVKDVVAMDDFLYAEPKPLH